MLGGGGASDSGSFPRGPYLLADSVQWTESASGFYPGQQILDRAESAGTSGTSKGYIKLVRVRGDFSLYPLFINNRIALKGERG